MHMVYFPYPGPPTHVWVSKSPTHVFGNFPMVRCGLSFMEVHYRVNHRKNITSTQTVLGIYAPTMDQRLWRLCILASGGFGRQCRLTHIILYVSTISCPHVNLLSKIVKSQDDVWILVEQNIKQIDA